MFKWIDDLLNRVTMYRLVLYVLLFLLGVAFVLCTLGLLPFSPFSLLFSTSFITIICWIANEISARVFEAPRNVESVYITALILALIITPASTPFDPTFFSLAIWASAWAMASKYLFAIGKKHLFNPAAIAVVVTALALNQSASWWVGTSILMPFVFVSGILIVKKLRRFDLFLSFFCAALLAILGAGLLKGTNLISLATRTMMDTPLFFFAFVMLTEPLTSPPTRMSHILYGTIVGVLFAPWIHIGSFYTTPELALVLGNVFTYLVSPKQKLLLRLKAHPAVAKQTSDFIFHPDEPLAYEPGQYMEWTLEHPNPDSRGNRRYFTLASSPTEENLRLGIKFYSNGSSFKKALSSMNSDDVIVAAQLAGDFVLPKDPSKKLVFIAGGIGITPFRSMIKYLVDRKEKRDIVLFYSNKFISDIAYADIFDEAEKMLGIKVIYTLTEKNAAPHDWLRKTGYIDANMIASEVPDFRERLFYLSGPHGMVSAFDKTLRTMGVPKRHIKKDFFPGF